MGFTLDGHARRKELAHVARVLRRDAGWNGLRALEGLAGIERFALRARMEVAAAARAAAREGDLFNDDVAAARAPHHVAEAGHAGRAALERFAFGLVQARFDAVGGRLRRGRVPALRLGSLAPLILISALPILTIRHSRLPASGCRLPA